MTEVKVLIEAVKIEGRHRKDLGDISGLAKSIAREGLIHAITVTPDNRLLAGERRLAAVRSLGWKVVEARVVDSLDDAASRLRVERDENTERKAMTPSELVSLGLALEELERPKAAERRASAPIDKRSDLLIGTGGGIGETRQIVAGALGISPSSYDRAKAVVTAANDSTLAPEDRRIAQEALSDMDETGRISPSFNRVKERISARTGARQQTRIETVAKQRRAISSAENAMSGLCHGLQQIELLHPDITSEEAARWADSLSESRRVITLLINRLKERTNAQSS